MLAKLLAAAHHDLSFNLLEVGARPIGEAGEPFYGLLDVFPSSRLSALEIDPALCEELNRDARPGMRYYPRVLGKTSETRPLYETTASMCTSLYPPDERYAQAFHDLSVMTLARVSEVDTVGLDGFVRDCGLGALDFVKMDIQGAELDVLQGGANTLASVLMLVCEVEFVPLYKGQPLFADVDTHLRGRGFMLHKFLGMGGRVMKPLAAHGMAHYPVQMMWSDALYTRELLDPQKLTEEQLLKLAVLLDLYDSKDVALYLLRHYDARRGSKLGDSYMALLEASGVWSLASGARSTTA